jgi:hypothetical protein
MRNKFLPLLVFLVFTFHFSLVKAQDTLAPPINMSQSAYDSIIRALKKTSSPGKDTVKPAVDSAPKTRVILKRGDMLDNDSARQVIEHHRMDSAMRHVVQDTVKQATDTVKKMKVIKLSNKHGGMDANDSARIATKHHRRDSIMQADSVALAKKYSRPKKDTIHIKFDTIAHKHKIKWVPSGFIAFNFGIGLPLDNYVSVGYAATGENLSLCAVFPGLLSRFGWAFKFDYGLNGINNSQYLYNAAEGYPNYTFKTISTAQGYTYYTLMMGPSFSFPYGKITFDVKVLLGTLTGTIPKSVYNVVDSGSSLFLTKYQATSTAFAFGFGIDVRYHILPYVSILLNYDYLTSTPTFSYVSNGFTDTPLGIIPSAAQVTTVNQGFQLNNLTIGVALTLAAKKGK